MKKIYVQWLNRIWLALLGAGLLVGQVAWAQSIPDAQWARVGKKLIITTDGNIVTSEALSLASTPPFFNRGERLVKYSPQGNQLWATGLLKGGFYIGGRLPDIDYEAISRVTAAGASPNGGVTVAGPLNVRGGSNVVVRVTAGGTPEVWSDSQIFNSFVSDDFPRDLITTADGGYLVLSSITRTNEPSSVLVQKFDALKALLWQKQIAYPNPAPASPDRSYTKGRTIISTPDGGYLVSGYFSESGVSGPQTGWVAKLDAQGNVSWQKLLTGLPMTGGFNGPTPGEIIRMNTVTDAMLSPDGFSYVLAGTGILPGSVGGPPPATALLELDLSGDFRRGRAKAIDAQATDAFLTVYIGAGGKRYYAVGNSSLQNGMDPQILLVDPVSLPMGNPGVFNVVAKRTFEGPGESFLTDIGVAGDGGLVFVTTGNQLVKLGVESTPTEAFRILQPTYNCQTGAITFNTTGGNGSSITYSAPGVSRANPTDNFGIVETGLRNDPKVIPITATQSGVSVTYNFDLRAACGSSPVATPQPPRLNGPIPNQSLTVGQSIYFPVGSFFTDPTVNVPDYRSNWSIGVSGLPDGLYTFYRPQDLQFTPAIVILGSTVAVGQYTVTVTASTEAFRSSPITTTFIINVSASPQPGNALSLLAPEYNCATGAITFRTSGGDGSLITYSAPGISRANSTDNFGIVETGLRNDPKVIPITATQSGVSVTYNFDLRAACSSSPVATPQPPRLSGPIPNQSLQVSQSINFPVGSYFTDPTVNVPNYRSNWSIGVSGLPSGLSLFINPTEIVFTPAASIVGNPTTAGVYTVTVTASTEAFRGSPITTTFIINVSASPQPGSALSLLAPTYDCATGAITFRTSGGDGSPVEFQSVGITSWSSNSNQFVDRDSRTANDVQPFLLMARQNGQVVTYLWDLKAACGRARLAANEAGTGLQVRVLGNPVMGEWATVEVQGAEGESLLLHVLDVQGRVIGTTTRERAARVERVSLKLGQTAGVYFLDVRTPTQRRSVRLIKPL